MPGCPTHSEVMEGWPSAAASWQSSWGEAVDAVLGKHANCGRGDVTPTASTAACSSFSSSCTGGAASLDSVLPTGCHTQRPQTSEGEACTVPCRHPCGSTPHGGIGMAPCSSYSLSHNTETHPATFMTDTTNGADKTFSSERLLEYLISKMPRPETVNDNEDDIRETTDKGEENNQDSDDMGSSFLMLSCTDPQQWMQTHQDGQKTKRRPKNPPVVLWGAGKDDNATGQEQLASYLKYLYNPDGTNGKDTDQADQNHIQGILNRCFAMDHTTTPDTTEGSLFGKAVVALAADYNFPVNSASHSTVSSVVDHHPDTLRREGPSGGTSPRPAKRVTLKEPSPEAPIKLERTLSPWEQVVQHLRELSMQPLSPQTRRCDSPPPPPPPPLPLPEKQGQTVLVFHPPKPWPRYGLHVDWVLEQEAEPNASVTGPTTTSKATKSRSDVSGNSAATSAKRRRRRRRREQRRSKGDGCDAFPMFHEGGCHQSWWTDDEDEDGDNKTKALVPTSGPNRGRPRVDRWTGHLHIVVPKTTVDVEEYDNIIETSNTAAAAAAAASTTPSKAKPGNNHHKRRKLVEIGRITCYSINGPLHDLIKAAEPDEDSDDDDDDDGIVEVSESSAEDPAVMHFSRTVLRAANPNTPAATANRKLKGKKNKPRASSRRSRSSESSPPEKLDQQWHSSPELFFGPNFLIGDLFIHQDYRGTGLGLYLVDAACRRVADPLALVVLSLRSTAQSQRSDPAGHQKKSSGDVGALSRYFNLLGFVPLTENFVARRNGRHAPRMEEICPHMPKHASLSSDRSEEKPTKPSPATFIFNMFPDDETEKNRRKNIYNPSISTAPSTSSSFGAYEM